MRLKSLLPVAVAATAFGLAAHEPAKATDHTAREHRAWKVHTTADPYSYQYEHRGYYPYYNSRYWVPAHVMRYRSRYNFVLPKYYKAWGYPKASYHHRAWHARHHGRHYPWHW